MDKKITWLRISYWTAAIADFIIAILSLIPARMGVASYVYPMGLMSAVAFSWGVLLIFADRRPLERRWILIPTSLVVALIGIVVLHAGLTKLTPVHQFVPAFAAAIGIFSILIYSYMNSRDLQ